MIYFQGSVFTYYFLSCFVAYDLYSMNDDRFKYYLDKSYSWKRLKGEVCLLAGGVAALSEQRTRGRQRGHGHAVPQEHDHVARGARDGGPRQARREARLRLRRPVALAQLALRDAGVRRRGPAQQLVVRVSPWWNKHRVRGGRAPARRPRRARAGLRTARGRRERDCRQQQHDVSGARHHSQCARLSLAPSARAAPLTRPPRLSADTQ